MFPNIISHGDINTKQITLENIHMVINQLHGVKERQQKIEKDIASLEALVQAITKLTSEPQNKKETDVNMLGHISKGTQTSHINSKQGSMEQQEITNGRNGNNSIDPSFRSSDEEENVTPIEIEKKAILQISDVYNPFEPSDDNEDAWHSDFKKEFAQLFGNLETLVPGNENQHLGLTAGKKRASKKKEPEHKKQKVDDLDERKYISEIEFLEQVLEGKYGNNSGGKIYVQRNRPCFFLFRKGEGRLSGFKRENNPAGSIVWLTSQSNKVDKGKEIIDDDEKMEIFAKSFVSFAKEMEKQEKNWKKMKGTEARTLYEKHFVESSSKKSDLYHMASARTIEDAKWLQSQIKKGNLVVALIFDKRFGLQYVREAFTVGQQDRVTATSIN